MGVCGLCRALTPPNHHSVIGRGQGPAQEAVLVEGRSGREAVEKKTGRTVKEGRWKSSQEKETESEREAGGCGSGVRRGERAAGGKRRVKADGLWWVWGTP